MSGLNQQDLAAAHDLIAVLSERFPTAFTVFNRRVKLLKIGILGDLLVELPDVDTQALSGALRIYCRQYYYLRQACAVGAPRVDLHGNIVGAVTEKEAIFAKKESVKQNVRQARRMELLALCKAKAVRQAKIASRLSFAGLKAAAAARRVTSL